MSDVKRYAVSYGCVVESTIGPYVLHTDYAAMKAERDELARLTAKLGDHKTFVYCMVCERALSDGHAADCPVKLAERILKEVGDGR
ncbi:MAG TPA: hypothetical protein VE028_04145 [Nitratidesulfovibrio sp.]|nr:hypothetical protein [Nitratidesulfovibrio sp.]